MAHDETGSYNGWSNYETWAVSLWINNTEGSYRHWTDRTRELLAETGDGDEDRTALARLAEELKDAIHEECAVPEATLAADLINAALGEVDWYEIARGMIEDQTSDTPDDSDLIYAYTRADALADGTLIDVTPTAKEVGFRYPVAVTAAVWHDCVRIPEGVSGQDEVGRLWDVLTMLLHASRRARGGESTLYFDVLVLNDHTCPKPVRLKAVCGPNDDLSPCVTIMLPEED
jgi:hypothetical protein